jgi:hypothetical protein
LGYVRYDTADALAAINDLYRHELRLFQNLFLPSVKLVRKERIGARLRRRYDAPRTPLDRVRECPGADAAKVATLSALRDRLDPFTLAQSIDKKLERLYGLANHRQSPTLGPPAGDATLPALQRPRCVSPSASAGSPSARMPPTMIDGGWLHHEWLDDWPSGNILKWLDG